MAVDAFSILFPLNHKNTFKSIRILVGILIAARVAAGAAGTSPGGRGLTADRKPGTIWIRFSPDKGYEASSMSLLQPQ